jgi:hypothetical protein
MSVLAIALLTGQLLVILGVVVRDTLDPSREALTMKTMFLLGFALFQPGSALFTLFTGEVDVVGPNDEGRAAFTFALMSTAFLVLFAWFYGRATPVARLAFRPSGNFSCSDGSLLTIGFLSLACGVVLRDLLGALPVLGVLTIMLSAGFFTTSCACAAWAWARNPGHLGKALIAATIIFGTAVALLQNAFSRRGLVAAVLSTIWAAYFARWRSRSRAGLLAVTLLIGGIGFAFVLLQSATRGSKGRGGSIADYLEAFTRIEGRDLLEPALAMASGQFAGVNSMWLIENYPSQHTYWPLHSIWYFVTQPIPRVIWEGKPWSLGNEMVHQVGVTGVKRDEFSLGPGIVGHINVDVPFIALPLYAWLIAWALRYMDDRTSTNAASPFVVIPISAATSQVLGMPRGELGLFAFNALAWTTGGWIAMNLLGRWARRPPDLEENLAETVSGQDDARLPAAAR